VHGSVLDKLIKKSGTINVYVIQASKEEEQAASIATTVEIKPEDSRAYLYSFTMVAAVTAVGWLLRGNIELVNIALLYQLPATLSAFWWGRWPSYFTAVCSVLVFDFLFVPPIFTFTVEDVRFLWSFLTFLVVAFVIGGRTELLRHEAKVARRREKSTRALFEFSRNIAAVVDIETIAGQLSVRAADTLGREVVVLLPDDTGRLLVRAQHSPAEGQAIAPINKNILVNSAEAAVATWAYEHREVAGRSTETLPGAEFLYLPLHTRDSVVGVLGIHVKEKLITPEQRREMEAWAGLAAIVIERVNLAAKANEAAMVMESERLRTALLNSISHELRTPLASVIGSASTLLEAETLYTPKDRRELLENIKDGADRMDRVIANLLDTARLESGMIRLKMDWCDIEDVVGAALRRIPQTGDRPLTVSPPKDITLVRGDCVLLEQVVVNLVDNALKYSRAGTPVAIDIDHTEHRVKVAVADRGIGIPEAELSHVFDKFYRAYQPERVVGGTGLGLSICKGIIEAHGGEIWAENRPGGGAVISFALPVQGLNDIPPERR
jgi:two-component system sensor histidine kinase KdpD